MQESVPTTPTPAAGDDHVYLTAHASLKDYLAFIATEPVDPSERDRQRAADAWRAARTQIQRLEEQEPGWADNPPVLPMPIRHRSMRSMISLSRSTTR